MKSNVPPAHAEFTRLAAPEDAAASADGQADRRQRALGAQVTTVTVHGHCATDTWVHGSSYSAVAYVVVPKIVGGLWYTVTGRGFNDTAYYGQQLSLTFSAAGAVPRPADGHGDTRVQDRGDTLWVCLSSISGPLANLHEAEPYFNARFGGMRVSVRVSVRAPPG